MEATQEFGHADFAHLKHCLADLRLIREKTELARMSWQDVRACALPLRRLLLDNGGEIPRCWRLVGRLRQRFEIVAKELPVTAIRKELLVACGNWGEASNRICDEFGATISLASDFDEKEAHAIQWLIDRVVEHKNFGIADYLSSVRISICGTPITRREVLSYVANKAGGVHVDTRPRDPKGKEERIEKHANKIWYNGKSLPYLEVQSMAGQLICSPHSQELLAELESKLGDHLEWHFV